MISVAGRYFVRREGVPDATVAGLDEGGGEVNYGSS